MQRWDPFLDSFRIVERFGGRFRDDWHPDGAELEGSDATVPRADLFDDRDGVTIEVELPGVGPNDVTVSITDGTVIIEAERSFVRNGRNVLQLEMPYGRMRREFQLPIRSQPSKAMAEMKLGVLRIYVPRLRQTSTETISVKPEGEDSPRPVTIH